MLVACPGCHRQYDVGGMKRGEQVRCRCGNLIKVPARKPHSAKILHCSSCGAQLRNKTSNCNYCGGQITASERNLGPPCPECFARMQKGASFCSECGIAIKPEAVKAIRLSTHCPRCKGDFILHEFEGGHYTECSLCAGIWLDPNSFNQIIEKKEESSLGKLFASKKTIISQKQYEKVRYLPCPTCGQLMHRKNFGRVSGVIVDWCKDHGYWFDTNELEKVISFVKKGGMQLAREREIQNQKAELKRLKDHTAGTSVFSESSSSSVEIDLFSSLRGVWSVIGTLLR